MSKNRCGKREHRQRETLFAKNNTLSPLSPYHHIHQQKHTHIAKADRRKKEPLVCYAAVGVVVVVI
jgi:hypothetical protein